MEFLQEIRTHDQVKITAKLAREIWTEHYGALLGQAQIDYMLDKFQSVTAITKNMAEGMRYFWFLDKDDVVGYFAFQMDNAAGEVFLSKLYVRKSARGQGLARHAFVFLTKAAREQGLHYIRLTVNKNNSSVDAYHKLGLTIVNSIIKDIGKGFVMDDYVMEMSV